MSLDSDVPRPGIANIDGRLTKAQRKQLQGNTGMVKRTIDKTTGKKKVILGHISHLRLDSLFLVSPVKQVG